MKLSGNTVLITGGATGIGFVLAQAFKSAGNEVIICGRRVERLIEAQQKCPGIHIRQCDVTDKDDRDSLVSWITGSFENFNVLINNAGIQQDIDLRTPQDLLEGDSEIRIDLEAPIFLASQFIPYLTSKKDAAIINVSSMLGLTPLAMMPVYCAAKAGLHVFTKCLRKQLSASGIKVFELLPPALDTELNLKGRQKRAAAGTPSSYKMMPLEDYIAYVMKSLENDMLEIMNPGRPDMKNVTMAELDRIFESMNGHVAQ